MNLLKVPMINTVFVRSKSDLRSTIIVAMLCKILCCIVATAFECCVRCLELCSEVTYFL